MKHLALKLSFILITISLSAHAQPYTNEEYGISIQFPQDWRLKSSAVSSILIKARRESKLLSFMSLSAYDLGEEFNFGELPPKELLNFSVGYDENVDATLLDSGFVIIDGIKAPWIKYQIKSPPIASGYALDCFVNNGSFVFKIGGRTDPNKDWFDHNTPLFINTCKSFEFESKNNFPNSNTTQNHADSFKSSGDSPMSAFLKTLGSRFAKYVLIGVLLTAISMFFKKQKAKK
jgi:hypothetical protein